MGRQSYSHSQLSLSRTKVMRLVCSVDWHSIVGSGQRSARTLLGVTVLGVRAGDHRSNEQAQTLHMTAESSHASKSAVRMPVVRMQRKRTGKTSGENSRSSQT